MAQFGKTTLPTLMYIPCSQTICRYWHKQSAIDCLWLPVTTEGAPIRDGWRVRKWLVDKARAGGLPQRTRQKLSDERSQCNHASSAIHIPKWSKISMSLLPQFHTMWETLSTQRAYLDHRPIGFSSKNILGLRQCWQPDSTAIRCEQLPHHVHEDLQQANQCWS